MLFKKKEKQPKPNTLVIGPRDFGLEYVSEPEGKLWLYGDQWVYLMKRKEDGTLEPIELPPKIGVLPEKLYRALNWDKEVNILFALRSSLLEKLNTFSMYLLIGILLFFIYLIFSSL